ncbi:MAG: hypothetical protein VKO21_03790 [Candidatus Sericytochromatia bacterium]|nr:hypothetical protein [Candidatus Sericytochromatia bacterium]
MTDVVVVPHTHWDREWYRTFQGYRLRLADAVRRVLDLLEEGKLPHFLLDGQTVLLDDHLEIHPEDEPRLRHQVGEGRLAIGPWYILPDEFLVSGESLIRNLMFGRARMQRFGAQGPGVGYLPDQFGHPAQLPLILRGFGMDRALMWRGVDPPDDHFWWEDLSGGGLASLFLPTGYCNIHLWSDASAVERQEAHDKFLAAQSRKDRPLLLLSGCDHLAPSAALPERVAAVGARLGRIEEALPPPDKGTLPVVHGELRHQGRAYLLPDVASTRTYLKQANAALEDQWERTVEPLMVLAARGGRPVAPGFWAEGWELVLKNHPHDSICGCSIDAVHREMAARTSQAENLGKEITARVLRTFAPREVAPGVMVFDPAGAPAAGWHPIEVLWPDKDGEAPETVHLEGVSTLPVSRKSDRHFICDIDVHPDTLPVARFEVMAYLPEMAIGQPLYLRAMAGGCPLPLPTPALEVWPEGADNGQLRLEITEGRLQVRHRGLGLTVPDLFRFVDGGDAGDSYTYSPPTHDRLIQGTMVDYDVRTLSAAAAELVITHQLKIPVGVTPDRQGRTVAAVRTDLITTVRLVAGEDTLWLETRWENMSHDHRLRMVVDSGLSDAKAWWSETAFGAVPRQPGTGLGPLPVAPLAEATPPTFPHLGWVAVEGSSAGAQVVARGLAEAEITEGGRSVALTLLRAVGWLSRDDLRTRGGGAGPAFPTPEAQCEGPAIARVAVRWQHRPDDTPAWWASLGALDRARRTLVTEQVGGVRQPLCGGLPLPDPLLTSPLPHGLRLSALKPAHSGTGTILRVHNPTGRPVDWDGPEEGAWQACRLDETPIEGLQAPWSVGAGDVLTLVRIPPA